MNRIPENPAAPLDALIEHAIGYADFALSNIGRVPPTMIAVTPDGVINYLPESMGNEKAKDDFANTMRFIVLANRATCVVLILESWMALADKDGNLPKVPASQASNRQEVVVIQAESTAGNRTMMLPIQRHADGKFKALDKTGGPNFDNFQGRFAGILPAKPITDEMQTMARQILAVMGITPDGLRVKPGNN